MVSFKLDIYHRDNYSQKYLSNRPFLLKYGQADHFTDCSFKTGHQ